MSWLTENPPNKGKPGHKHEFHALHSHFGPYGPPAVHYHPCFDENCDRILVGQGRDCEGTASMHECKWLGYQVK